MPTKNGASGTGVVAQVRRLLPRGHTLPPEELRRRHRALLALLWVHAVVVPLWGLDRGYGLGHSLVEGGAIAVCAAAATIVGPRRRGGPLLVALGLLTASAVIVHLSGGVIEAHFHFFVVIVLLTLYEDWMIFLFAAAFVVLHHGVGGALDPHAVFNHSDAEANPWRWAMLHAAYVLAAGLAAVVAWRLNEDLRDRHVGLIAEKQAALERAEAAERELERHARELERSNRELDEFASIASHDLTAPLVTVSGFLTLLEERYGDRLDAEAGAFIAHAVGGTQRMQLLIADLLEYARVGRAALEAEDVDLAAVARQTVAGLRGPIEEAGAAVVVDPLPVVHGYAHELGRLLQNLIGNAVKYSGDARPVVHVGARRTAEGWEVSVVDNGVGVDPADREQIFKMFDRRARTGRRGHRHRPRDLRADRHAPRRPHLGRPRPRRRQRVSLHAAGRRDAGRAARGRVARAAQRALIGSIPSAPATAWTVSASSSAVAPACASSGCAAVEAGALDRALLVARPLAPRAETRVRGAERRIDEHPGAAGRVARARVRANMSETLARPSHSARRETWPGWPSSPTLAGLKRCSEAR